MSVQQCNASDVDEDCQFSSVYIKTECFGDEDNEIKEDPEDLMLAGSTSDEDPFRETVVKFEKDDGDTHTDNVTDPLRIPCSASDFQIKLEPKILKDVKEDPPQTTNNDDLDSDVQSVDATNPLSVPCSTSDFRIKLAQKISKEVNQQPPKPANEDEPVLMVQSGDDFRSKLKDRIATEVIRNPSHPADESDPVLILQSDDDPQSHSPLSPVYLVKLKRKTSKKARQDVPRPADSDDSSSVVQSGEGTPCKAVARPLVPEEGKLTYSYMWSPKKPLILRTRRNPGGFVCRLCDKRFLKMVGLHNHMVTHAGEAIYKCDLCEERFANADQLEEHARPRGASARPFACDVCPERFMCSAALLSHRQEHRRFAKPKVHHCKLCSIECKSASYLEIHNNEHHVQRPPSYFIFS